GPETLRGIDRLSHGPAHVGTEPNASSTPPCRRRGRRAISRPNSVGPLQEEQEVEEGILRSRLGAQRSISWQVYCLLETSVRVRATQLSRSAQTLRQPIGVRVAAGPSSPTRLGGLREATVLIAKLRTQVPGSVHPSSRHFKPA